MLRLSGCCVQSSSLRPSVHTSQHCVTRPQIRRQQGDPVVDQWRRRQSSVLQHCIEPVPPKVGEQRWHKLVVVGDVAQKPVHTVAEKCDNLSQKSETVAEKCDSRRISPLSRRFWRQSHFSATVSLNMRAALWHNCDVIRSRDHSTQHRRFLIHIRFQ